MITKLTLKNFRSHKDTTLNLAPINLFVGNTGSGKSSIRNAVEYALTGEVPEFAEGRNANLDRHVQHGAKKAEVMLELDNLKISRKIPTGAGSLQVKDWTGTPTEQQKALYEELGVSKETVQAALNTSGIMDMDTGKQKELLFKLVDTELDERKLMAAVRKYAKDEGLEDDVSSELALTEVKMGYGANRPLAGGIELIDGIYKWAYAERTGVKKKADEAAGSLKTLKETAAVLPQGITLEHLPAIEDQLAKLKEEHDNLLQQKGKADGSDARKEAMEKRLAEIEAEDAALEEIVNAERVDPETLEAELKELRAKMKATDDKLTAANRSKLAADSNIDRISESINRLMENKGKCPVAAGVECTSLDYDTLMAKYDKERAEAAEESKAAEAECSQISVSMDCLMKKAAAVQESIRTARDAISEAQTATRRRGNLSEDKERLEKELADLGQLDSLEAIEEKLTALSGRIEKGTTLKNTVTAVRDGADNLKKAEKLAKETAEMVDAYEFLCTAFGPKGIKQAILAETVGKLEQIGSERLQAISGFQLRFITDPDFEVQVIRNGATDPAKNLSDGERYMVGVAVQYILAKLSGFPLIILDRIEMLDPGCRMKVFKMLDAVKGDVQSMVMAVRGEKGPIHPGWEGLKVYMVDSGTVTEILPG